MNKYLRFVTGLGLVAAFVYLSIAVRPIGFRRDQLSMVVICGGEMDCEAHKEAVRGAVKFLHDENIYVTWEEGPRFYQEVYSPWMGLQGISLLIQRAIWRNLIAGNVKKDYDIINLALPYQSRFPYLPWEAGILGIADGICTVPERRNSIVITKQTDEADLNRLIVEHEILHVLGAPHSETGIMTATADNPNEGEYLAKDTREYVDRCLRRPWRK